METGKRQYIQEVHDFSKKERLRLGTLIYTNKPTL
jgi:hypothetical protein